MPMGYRQAWVVVVVVRAPPASGEREGRRFVAYVYCIGIGKEEAERPLGEMAKVEMPGHFRPGILRLLHLGMQMLCTRQTRA